MRFNRYLSAAIFYLVCFFLGSFSASAQIKNALKFLKKNEFERAQSAFEVDLTNKAEQACAEFYLAQLHANPDYQAGYDLALAFQYVEKAIASAKKADPAARKKIDARGFGLLTMQKYREEIINTALEKAEQKVSSSAYNEFIRTYTNLNVAQTERVARARNRLAFQEASSANSASAWQRFWKDYRASCSIYSPDLHKQAQFELFGAYIRQHTWRAYANFANQYEDNILVRDSAAAVKMQLTAQKNTIPAYKSMLEAYPTSPFASIALDSLYAHTLRSSDPVDFDYFAHAYPNHPRLPALLKVYYPLYCKENPGCPDGFYKHYPRAQK